ncbi:MAG: hypothetical protein SGARI_006363 [Bacillariaceae sp.]
MGESANINVEDLEPANQYHRRFVPLGDKIKVLQDFSKLTLAEQNLAYEDVHGVAELVKETPELIEKACHDLLQHLSETDYPNKASYLKALEKGSGYVHSTKMLLAWLRCDRFDIPASAQRYVNYWALVDMVFGESNLGRDILLSDLPSGSVEHLKSYSHIQFLSQRDAAGRAIQFLDPFQLAKMYSGSPADENICVSDVTLRYLIVCYFSLFSLCFFTCSTW